jgi:hypothetical protein
MDSVFMKVAKDELNLFCKDTLENIPKSSCPDQYVGKIAEFKLKKDGGSGDFPIRSSMNDVMERGKCLIMILESPHESEFDGQRNGKGPAHGATGSNLRNKTHWEQIFGNDYDDYGLILINAVRYQCSLGISTDCVRSSVFSKVWQQGGKEDFIKRLLDFTKRGDVIVNCCTVGGDKKHSSLHNLVQSVLYEELRERLIHNGVTKFLKGTHPSSWRVNGNRKIQLG